MVIGSDSSHNPDATYQKNVDIDLGDDFKLGTDQSADVLTIVAKGSLIFDLSAGSFVIDGGKGATGTLNLFGEGKNLNNTPEGSYLPIDGGKY